MVIVVLQPLQVQWYPATRGDRAAEGGRGGRHRVQSLWHHRAVATRQGDHQLPGLWCAHITSRLTEVVLKEPF